MKNKPTMNTLKTLLFILLFTLSVSAQVTVEEATQTALLYKEPIETIDLEPNHRVTVGADRYWPIEIKRMREIMFIAPIHTETGELAEENQWTQIMKTHYLANFFSTNNAVRSYFQSSKRFGQDKQALFEEGKGELIFYEGQINTTLPSMAPLQQLLDEGMDQAEKLRYDSIDATSAITKINTPDDVLTSFNKIQAVFNAEEALINKGKEINQKVSELDKEVVQARSEGKISDGVATALLQVTSPLSDNYIPREDTLRENRNTVLDFFNSLDSKVDDFKTVLKNRVDVPEEEQQRNQVINQLNEYSTTLTNISEESHDVPQRYLDDENFDSIYEETIQIITESQAKCSPEEELSTCLQAKENYQEIETNIAILEEVLEGYTPCVEGQTRTCTVNGEQGTQECIGGQWTTCRVVEELSTINWRMIALLSLLIIALIAYKYKDQIFQPTEEQEEQEGEQYGDFWK